jgi:hypothetical protein
MFSLDEGRTKFKAKEKAFCDGKKVSESSEGLTGSAEGPNLVGDSARENKHFFSSSPFEIARVRKRQASSYSGQ